MADKITQHVTDALTRGAAEPGGLPLYASKADAGLFPNTAAAKPAAQKCLADDLVRVVAPDAKGKSARDLYGLTEKGWEFLLAAVNPKQVLEDFVRVLEARQGEVGELLDTARQMANSLQGLKDAVSRVLPGVSVQRVKEPTSQPPPSREGELDLPSPLAGEGSERSTKGSEQSERVRGKVTPHVELHPSPGGEAPPPSPARGEGKDNSPSLQGGGWGVGLLTDLDLAPAILAHLADHTGPTDCTLPELFRALARNAALTIGEFHDCLRQLCADGAVSLPAWTGPLYALPEPQYALLIGHGIAYYASLRG